MYFYHPGATTRSDTHACPDEALTQLGNKTVMEANGWTFVTSHHDMVWYASTCGTDSWYGLHAGHTKGSVSAVFKGSGNATLSFGNCWHVRSYSVKAYLNRRVISTAIGNVFTNVSFTFIKGDTLKIEEDGAIIKLKSLAITCN